MSIQRIVFLVVLMIQAGVTAAAQQNVLPKWTPFLALIGTVLTALMSSIAPKDPPPPAGPSKLAAFLLVIGALAVGGSVSACGVFTKAMPFLPTPNDLACVANDVERNVTNPLTIVSDCPGLAQTAIADVEALVVDLVASKKAAHRAAAEHAAETCDAGADSGK